MQDQRKVQKRLQLNRTLQFKAVGSATLIEITVSNLARDSMTGSLAALPGTAGAK
jgi:hypothetical protein